VYRRLSSKKNPQRRGFFESSSLEFLIPIAFEVVSSNSSSHSRYASKSLLKRSEDASSIAFDF
jgi:hypothetical protein